MIVAQILLAALATAAGDAWPMPDWQAIAPEAAGLDASKLAEARDYALTGGGSGVIIRAGRLVIRWGPPEELYDLKSTTKSFGATALGLAILDGKVQLDDRARTHCPDLGVPPAGGVEAGPDRLGAITIRQLATQTAGFEKPGGFGRLLHDPGTTWHYSDGGPNWLADCLTHAYGRDLDALMFDRVFGPIGIARDDLRWRKNQYRPQALDGVPRREFGAGIHANVDAMARLGLLYLRGGTWDGKPILPRTFVDAARTTVEGVVGLPEGDAEVHGNASDHYGLLWWNNADGSLPGVPRDAFWSWGLYDSLIVVIPGLDIVAARAGRSWARAEGAGHYDVLRPFLGPIAASAVAASPAAGAPYPPSQVIVGIDWAPASTIVRRARGGDNWPLTWGDDDAQYTCFGDARGFEPFLPRKLSMGPARVIGPADAFHGENILAPTLEQIGEGGKGRKASGILMVDGVLHLWTRNVGRPRLARSADHGRTWTWAPWGLEAGFGCPTFLNFGKDYAGARDDYVYTYSPDAETAYDPADRLVLARVPKERIGERPAFEFFAGLDAEGRPTWSGEIDRRASAFDFPGRCYRSSASFHPGLKRYLLVQIVHGEEPRFKGGFGIYEAPEPWGPWSTAFFTEDWDVGPGETASLPTKWMADDGRTVYHVSSSDDTFCVREARLVLGEHRP